MGYVVKPDQDVWVKVPGDRAHRLQGGAPVPAGLPDAEYERLDRAGLIELAAETDDVDLQVCKPKGRRARPASDTKE